MGLIWGKNTKQVIRNTINTFTVTFERLDWTLSISQNSKQESDSFS